jgi:hypothetical protein
MGSSLIDRPFVSQNLISTQESPVSLPKLQMAQGLKILMFSGSKKGTKIYSPFSQKVPASESPSKFPCGSGIQYSGNRRVVGTLTVTGTFSSFLRIDNVFSHDGIISA